MSVTKSFLSLVYGAGILVSLWGVELGQTWVLLIGVLLLVIPGFIRVPHRVYVRMTSEEVVKLDEVIENYMSGFADTDDVTEEINKIMKAHGKSR